MGTRAFSHDSIFMPDGQEEEEQVAQTMSQDILGKVKTLQQQLAKNIKFGQPPTTISAKKAQDTEAGLEEEELSCSPMDILNQLDSTLQDSGNKSGDSPNSLNPSSLSEMGKGAEEKVVPVKLSHAKRSLASSGTIESINLDDVPQAGARLDNSAAKHKLLVKPRHQRLSKKHRRSTKDVQNVAATEFEENTTESLPYKETYQVKNGHLLSEQQNDDMERQKQIELEKETRRKEEEHQRLCEIEEKRQKAEAEEKRLDNQRRQELEEQRKEKEKKRLEEEKRQQFIEEEKRLKLEEQRSQEAERQRQEEQRRQELEECRLKEEQRKHALEEEKRLKFEEIQRQEEEKRRKEEQMQHEMEVRRQEEEQRQLVLKEQKRLETEEQQHQEEEKRKQEEQRQQMEEEKQKKIEEQKLLEMQQQQQQADQFRQQQEKEKMGEEMRWQELDQRQTMPKSYTFKVSSGEKQIIFEKVNLSPVTPVKEVTLSSDVNEPKANISSALPSALSVPHTAILVTGAQLCGPAVNFNQIKDTACKSLLGLTEERKTMDIPPLENILKATQETKPGPSKTKFTSEMLENQSALAELASIRSRILKNAENGKIHEKDQQVLSRYSDDWTPKGKGDSHINLRKTLSASAKFSITPAWQKFSEAVKACEKKDCISTAKQTDEENASDKSVLCDSHTEDVTDNRTLECREDTLVISTSAITKQVKMMDSTEGCKFAKDLPSFLVPTLPQSPCKESPQPESPAKSETQLTTAMRKSDKAAQNGEEKTSPFGIKLRRTNYSLRFHSDQQSEQKRKKRYSAGDSFDGVPSSWITADCEKETSYVSGNQMASTSNEKTEMPSSVFKLSSSNVCGSSHSTIAPLLPLPSSLNTSPSNEKTAPKPQLLHKPTVAPKPPSHTPPSSPLARVNRSNMADAVAPRTAPTDSETERKKEDNAASTVSLTLQTDKNEDEEVKEKKSFFPSINIPWREKSDKKSELIRKERPVLQSRHSIDGSRLMEKVESAQPLWITLALQKQKGFREQQATREERRQAREAKQAEKLAKENINAGVSGQPDSRGRSLTCTASVPQRPTAQKEDKKMETVVSWLERREQLKKSNTLPTSVTVEISDSVSSAPLAKEISKRFSTPDATPVSTEPAWLALAKRKAKAWSDCPQIIKQIH
ncbi:cancer-related regulator of actin dynamics isoform X2 [Rhinatrema bivittatum]|nr:cancer-related regulator of actin dynamics isoform X2 [Rhinatrema bivittatum]